MLQQNGGALVAACACRVRCCVQRLTAAHAQPHTTHNTQTHDATTHNAVSREAAGEYVSFHGLRNWGKTVTGNYLSHQIYVHSKVPAARPASSASTDLAQLQLNVCRVVSCCVCGCARRTCRACVSCVVVRA
jgi:hypothetical protein